MTRVEFEDKLIKVVRTWIGVPFLHHGRSRSQGVDCFGLMAVVFMELGMDIVGEYKNHQYKTDWYMHTPESLYLPPMLAKGDLVKKEDALPGDVHYFRPGLLSRTKIDRVTHTGIHLGRAWVGPDSFIHSFQNFQGVQVSSLAARAWQVSYGGTVRLKALKDALGET